MNTNNKWYQSSTGSENMALTIKGALLAIVPILIAVLSSQGYTLTENDVVEVINTGFTAVSAVMVFFGLARKMYYALVRE